MAHRERRAIFECSADYAFGTAERDCYISWGYYKMDCKEEVSMVGNRYSYEELIKSPEQDVQEYLKAVREKVRKTAKGTGSRK